MKAIEAIRHLAMEAQKKKLPIHLILSVKDKAAFKEEMKSVFTSNPMVIAPSEASANETMISFAGFQFAVKEDKEQTYDYEIRKFVPEVYI